MPDRTIDPDAVFPELVKYVIPAGYGLIGIIGAGLIGAILSSIDSMMNSAATIVTMDIYKKYMNPEATDAQLIRAGRISIIGFVLLATFLALFIMDPNSKKNFFLQIADYQNYLTPGILVAFFMGMFWPRGNGNGAFCAILSGIFFSWLAEFLYNNNVESWPAVLDTFGPKLNFFHRVVFVLPLSAALHIVVSLMTEPDEEKGRLNWTDLGGHKPDDLKKLVVRIALTLATFVFLAFLMVYEKITPEAAACLGALATFVAFQIHISQNRRLATDESGAELAVPLPRDDRFWASFLCSAAVFMHYYYY